MTADNITAERLANLHALLEAATDTVRALEWGAHNGCDPAEAAAIVKETIANLVAEAR